jgi:5,10-methenyltetrahydrofolate synthetase
MHERSLLWSEAHVTKADLRQLALAARARLTSEERIAGSAAIWERLQQLPEYRKAARLLVFVGFGTEVATLPMIKAMLRQGKGVFAPKVIAEEPDMELRQVTQPEVQLKPGIMGIPEPDETCPLVSADDFDLIVVPAVAWDLQGYRVGYGGGYFDRLLAHTGSTPRVGVGFDCQVFDEVVRAEHDLGVDVLVTESRLLRFARSR